jgi:hypothetical protein
MGFNSRGHHGASGTPIDLSRGAKRLLNDPSAEQRGHYSMLGDKLHAFRMHPIGSRASAAEGASGKLGKLWRGFHLFN